MGAVAAGLLFKGQIAWPTVFFILGTVVAAASFLSFAVTFESQAEQEPKHERAGAPAQVLGVAD